MKASSRQIDLLRGYGISDPPKTKGNCWLLIRFLKEGNGTRGETESERLALFLEAQKKWVGKKARFSPTNEEVVIKSIVPKDLTDVAASRRTLQEEGSDQLPSPFNAAYRYLPPNRGGSFSSLGLFTLVES